jgi:hypothetical protein
MWTPGDAVPFVISPSVVKSLSARGEGDATFSHDPNGRRVCWGLLDVQRHLEEGQ